MTRDEKGHFAKGVSGNPSGRKPREVEKDYLARLRSRISPEDWDAIIDKAIAGAKKGDAVDRKFIADYLIGPPVQRIAPTTPDGENEYMGAPIEQLIELVRKIAKSGDANE